MRKHRIAHLVALMIGVGVLAPIAMSAPAGANTVVNVPASVPSAPGPCPATAAGAPADATVALNAWFATAGEQSNTTWVLGAGRCYRVEGTLLIFGTTNNMLGGNGSTFRSYNDASRPTDDPFHSAHVVLRGNNNLLVQNVHVVGAATGGYVAADETQHGFFIFANVGLTLNLVSVDHVWGDFVSLQKTPNGNTPSSITIQNSNFGAASSGDNGAGRQEISIDDGIGVFVLNNYFGHGSRAAVDIEPTSTGADLQTIWFDSNTFGPNDLMWFANHGANATITSVWFTNNTLNRAMNVDSVVSPVPNVANPATFKRTDYQFVGNTSTVANGVSTCPDQSQTPPTPPPTDQRQMRFIGVNSLLVQANVQPMVSARCEFLVRADSVINGTVIDNSMLNGFATGYYTNSAICESGNRDGNPLHTAALSPGATAC